MNADEYSSRGFDSLDDSALNVLICEYRCSSVVDLFLATTR
jgi:hypothetical protein